MSYLYKKQTGFGLIEILIVGAIIAIAFIGLVSFLITSRGVTFQVARNTEATFLAEEGVEAVRSMRDETWSNISSLTSGTIYYPEISSVDNEWTLTTTNPGLISGLYTRTVVVENVNRDINDDIASSGSLDPNSKEVIVKVSWSENQVTKDVTLTTYITNFLAN